MPVTREKLMASIVVRSVRASLKLIGLHVQQRPLPKIIQYRNVATANPILNKKE